MEIVLTIIVALVVIRVAVIFIELHVFGSELGEAHADMLINKMQALPASGVTNGMFFLSKSFVARKPSGGWYYGDGGVFSAKHNKKISAIYENKTTEGIRSL